MRDGSKLCLKEEKKKTKKEVGSSIFFLEGLDVKLTFN